MVRPAFAILLLVSALACGPSGDDQGLQLIPTAPTGKVGEQIVIQAEPLEALATDLTWEVREPHGGGFLRSQGFTITYVAPANAGTYTLVAHARRADGSRFRATFPVQVLADPAVDPAIVPLAPGASQAFTARMKGLPRNTVTWTVEEPEGGEISPEGLYRAPRRSGTYHVLATSTVDASVSATATVKVE